ncbi:unnamed protein product [Peniophora sp. CBMAI 1063]|nr:unnamed protein product [Peniophora sp. CBMAI 1063]
MPPRPPQRGGGRGGPRGVGAAPRGAGPPRAGIPRGGPPRGGPPGRGGGGGTTRGTEATVAAHVEAIGVKRPNHGGTGRVVKVITNHFETQVPDSTIFHYDAISPSEKVLPIALCFEIVQKLQNTVVPDVFTPRGVHDGRKNLFSTKRYDFGEDDTATFDVVPNPTIHPESQRDNKGPKTYKVTLKKVAEVNPEVLLRFLGGKQTMDSTVQTALTALNVALRMEPSLRMPFNIRSFFTNTETSDIGAGIVLWRGYFQSIRPGIGRMFTNVDVSTGAMYKEGDLRSLCLAYLERNDPRILSPKHGLPDRERIRLQRFFQNVRVFKDYGTPLPEGARRVPYTVKKFTKEGARDLVFQTKTGSMTVAAYFQGVLNRPLPYPDNICAELSSGAVIPLELCHVIPGQIIRKQLPSTKTKDVLDFSTRRPADRLASIGRGLSVLAHGESEYVRQFGITVNRTLHSFNARVLDAPTLRYGPNSKQPTIQPRNGSWNMIEKKVYQPATGINEWVVVVYEQQSRFSLAKATEVIKSLREAANSVGVIIAKNPAILPQYPPPSGAIVDQLITIGKMCREKTKSIPSFYLIILPEASSDIYSAVKHFGDVKMGVPTQCLKSSKCSRAKQQYFANVILKLNPKLGGINSIADPRSVSFLTDPSHPTLVLGADVVHPAPGSDGRPSFSAVVGNIDKDSAKYTSIMGVQEPRVEIIEDLQSMVTEILQRYMTYRRDTEKQVQLAPKRIVFYRDGVSEGQFSHVLERELPLIKAACADRGVNAKITVIIVGKRHHVRFFPSDPRDGDSSGNCPAGTVVDTDVVNPVEFDFYLQSHGGLLGTSRPAHYNVLYDENGFTADGLQSLTFALTHVYARATRSVSIPAPVYYADIVCSRAAHHYARGDAGPDFTQTTSETADGSDAQHQKVEYFRKEFKPAHLNMSRLGRMYFC